MATESITGTRGLSVRERRQRNREEMRTGILAVARDIMREQGVAALNLNEIARRIGITPPALYTYFPGKMALYDALYRMGFRLFLEAEEELWRTTAPDWERIQRGSRCAWPWPRRTPISTTWSSTFRSRGSCRRRRAWRRCGSCTTRRWLASPR